MIRYTCSRFHFLSVITFLFLFSDETSSSNEISNDLNEEKSCYDNWYNNENQSLRQNETKACIHGLGEFSRIKFLKENQEPEKAYLPTKNVVDYAYITYVTTKSEKNRKLLCNNKNYDEHFYDPDNGFKKLVDNCKDHVLTTKINFEFEKYSNDSKVLNWEELIRNGFDFSKKTIFLTHGWTTETMFHEIDPADTNTPKRTLKETIFNRPFCDQMDTKINALLRPGMFSVCNPNRFNVIMMNWIPGSLIPYDYAVRHVPGVSRIVGNMIYDAYRFTLNEYQNRRKNFPKSQIYGPNMWNMVGFSLGAHTIGHTGKWVQKKMQHHHKKFGKLPNLNHITDKIDKLTGLDPASYGFQHKTDTLENPIAYQTADVNNEGLEDLKKIRLHKDDANLVVVIHSDAWSALGIIGAGTWVPSGHIDIFLNNATQQPRCISTNADTNLLEATKTILDVIVNSLSSTVCDHTTAPSFFGDCLRRETKGELVPTAYKSESFSKFLQSDLDFAKSCQNPQNGCVPIGLMSPNRQQSRQIQEGKYFTLSAALQKDLKTNTHLDHDELSVSHFCVDHVIVELDLGIIPARRRKNYVSESVKYSLNLRFEVMKSTKETKTRRSEKTEKTPDRVPVDFYTIENLQRELFDYDRITFKNNFKNKQNMDAIGHMKMFTTKLKILTTIPCRFRDHLKPEHQKNSTILAEKLRVFIDFKLECGMGLLFCEKYPYIFSMKVIVLDRVYPKASDNIATGRDKIKVIESEAVTLCNHQWEVFRKRAVCRSSHLNKGDIIMRFRKEQFCRKDMVRKMGLKNC